MTDIEDIEVKVDPDTGVPLTNEGEESTFVTGEMEDDVTDPIKDAIEEAEQVIEKIVPRKEDRRWVIGDKDSRVFIQKPLKYLAKLEFFAFLAKTLEEVMNADTGISLTRIIDSVKTSDEMKADEVVMGSLSLGMFRDPDMIIETVTKIVTMVPDFLVECYCMWLAVPRSQREDHKEFFRQELADEEGIGIMETFFEQNVEAIQDFFGRRMKELYERVVRMIQDRK